MWRDGPGLLLRDISRGRDPQVQAATEVMTRVQPDVILLQGFDYDLELRALTAFRDTLSAAGLHYPYIFALRPNTGMRTGQDLDGDGRLAEREDNQGFGSFSGQAGMAILSRYPVDEGAVQDLSGILWRDIPGALLPQKNGRPFPSAAALNDLRLAAVAQWVVPIRHPGGVITLLAFHASPPVFDGPEDFNGRRNHDQLIFWQHYMDGLYGAVPDARFVLLGAANQDPLRGDSRNEAIRRLLSDPRLQDTRPVSPSGQVDTVDWPDPGPGRMRVDYILPSRDWTVVGSGVYWPGTDAGKTASRHRLVWADLH